MRLGKSGMNEKIGGSVNFRSQRGLTLVEMMVVLVILALLTTVVVINVLPALDQASVNKAKADISTLENALEQYRLDMRSFPTTDQGLDSLLSVPSGVTNAGRYREGGYINKLPDDPWGNPYMYQIPGEFGRFDIYSFGADGRAGGEGLDADIGNWQ